MRKTKRWLVALAALLTVGSLLLPQIGADIHFFFSGEHDRLTLNPAEGWTAVLSGGKPLQFYLLLLAAVALLLLWVLFTSTYLNYRSNMQQITPDIITPCADGQGQFGTARWLSPSKYKSFFSIWRVRNHSRELRDLLDAGKNDRKEIHYANIHFD